MVNSLDGFAPSTSPSGTPNITPTPTNSWPSALPNNWKLPALFVSDGSRKRVGGSRKHLSEEVELDIVVVTNPPLSSDLGSDTVPIAASVIPALGTGRDIDGGDHAFAGTNLVVESPFVTDVSADMDSTPRISAAPAMPQRFPPTTPTIRPTRRETIGFVSRNGNTARPLGSAVNLRSSIGARPKPITTDPDIFLVSKSVDDTSSGSIPHRRATIKGLGSLGEFQLDASLVRHWPAAAGGKSQASPHIAAAPSDSSSAARRTSTPQSVGDLITASLGFWFGSGKQQQAERQTTVGERDKYGPDSASGRRHGASKRLVSGSSSATGGRRPATKDVDGDLMTDPCMKATHGICFYNPGYYSNRQALNLPWRDTTHRFPEPSDPGRGDASVPGQHDRQRGRWRADHHRRSTNYARAVSGREDYGMAAVE